MILYADIETDGFLDEGTQIHCLVTQADDGTVARYRGAELAQGVRSLLQADRIVFHNGIRFDIPFIQKLFPWFQPEETKVVDTLVLSRLVYPDLGMDDDLRIQQGQLASGYRGKHSLEAWGMRLGIHKGDFEGPWDTWTPEMEDYCVQDVRVLAALSRHLDTTPPAAKAVQLEYQVAWLMARQERHGFAFDVDKAEQLYLKLKTRQLELQEYFKQLFGGWYKKDSEVVPKVNNASGVTKGVPYTKIKWIQFNPASRDHIVSRLMKLYGWKPTAFTPKGKPELNEQTIKALDAPCKGAIEEFLLLDKRLGQLAEGQQAWLKCERRGRIHGGVIPNGAVTGRASHVSPNLAQVPAVYSPFGADCRALFRASPGTVLVGTDLSGLELRCLAHYMSKWDGGAYGELLLSGDIHTYNQQLAELPTRDNAKTFI
jgi:DNA polymerase-1